MHDQKVPVSPRLLGEPQAQLLQPNADPANADLQLSVLRNHASANGATSYGFAWRLGQPVSPLVLSFHNVSLVQSFNSSTASTLLRLGLASHWIDDTSNGGYGSVASARLRSNRGLSHYGPGSTPAVAGLERTLIVVFDTTPRAEFFLATLLRPSDDNYSLNLSILLFRSPAVSGWSLWFLRASGYVGMIGSNDRWSWRGDTPSRRQLDCKGATTSRSLRPSPGR